MSKFDYCIIDLSNCDLSKRSEILDRLNTMGYHTNIPKNAKMAYLVVDKDIGLMVRYGWESFADERSKDASKYPHNSDNFRRYHKVLRYNDVITATKKNKILGKL